MENIQIKEKIENTVLEVRNTSYQEKKNTSEEVINSFLDAILELKAFISTKTDKVNYLTGKLEEITWFDDLDDECMLLINDVIASSKDLFSSLVRIYANLNNTFRTKGIATEEVNKFRNAIEDFKESFDDLESIYFFLPQMPEFQETKKMLSLL